MRIFGALLALLITSCTTNGSEAAERRIDSSGRRDSIAGVAAASLGDAGVLGLLTHIHAADSALGVMGATYGSRAEVKDFGRMVMREHHALAIEATNAARTLGIAIVAPPTAPDDAPAEMKASVIAGKPGPAWDHNYIEYAVAMHKASFENIARALAAMQRPELHKLIEQSIPILQKHVDKAESLRKLLAKKS